MPDDSMDSYLDSEWLERMDELKRREKFIEGYPLSAWKEGDLTLKHAMFVAYRGAGRYWIEVIKRWFRAQRGPVKRKRLQLLVALLHKRLDLHGHPQRGRLVKLLWLIEARAERAWSLPLDHGDISDLALSDGRLRQMICAGADIKSADIPQTMVDAMRVHVRVKTLLKEKR